MSCELVSFQPSLYLQGLKQRENRNVSPNTYLSFYYFLSAKNKTLGTNGDLCLCDQLIAPDSSPSSSQSQFLLTNCNFKVATAACGAQAAGGLVLNTNDMQQNTAARQRLSGRSREIAPGQQLLFRIRFGAALPQM